MAKPRRRKRKVVDRAQITELGKHFFQYVKEKDEDWHTNMKRDDLRTCFMEEYKPWLWQELGRKPGYNFSMMIFYLRKQKQVKVIKGSGEVFYYEQTGYPTVDQHRLFSRQQQDVGEPVDRKFRICCEVCEVTVNSEQSQRDHIKGARHRLNLSNLALRQMGDSLFDEKHGVSIGNREDFPVQDGKIVVDCSPSEVRSVNLFVSFGDEAVSLELVTLLTRDPRLYITDDELVTEGRATISFQERGQEYEIMLRCESDDFGKVRAPIAFVFKVQSTNEVFHIFRVITFSVSGEDSDILTPTTPYSRSSTRVVLKPLSKNVLSGSPITLSNRGKLPQTLNLKEYYIPAQVSGSLNSNNPGEIASLEEPLSEENYSQKFENLLYTEEHQMKVDIRRYDKRGAPMTKSRTHRGLIDLEVPGLAENRPSVLRGDHLFATESDGSQNTSYRGFVHHIEQERVSLHFHDQLMRKFIDNMKFDIIFTFSRFPLRLQHFAVDSDNVDMAVMRELLFPQPKEIQEPADEEELRNLGQRKLFNRKLAENAEQVQAIHHILKGSSLPAPYLVFGPPGTGKTVTIVEAMKQVYHQQPGSVILACAPSNSAADLIAKRLLDTGPVAKSHLMRMSALSRSWEGVDPALKERRECLNYDDQYSVFFPAPDKIKEKRIVVVTMVTAGRLVLSDAFKDHFTHIFLDEAGHAIEPEALISVTGLLPRNGQLVLAGDPKQLGPVLRSPVSKQNGLELSFLERLMTTEEAYQRVEGGDYNDMMLTKLLCNYRSHPSILREPNNMFYEGELKVCADEIVRESLSRIDLLPKQGFPVIFHGIEGTDEREESSPSFFNAAEVEQVRKYVNDLLSLRGTKAVKQADIGIISPYRKQVQKIKKVLERKNLTDIKVGSVEEFQGQERLVIIISTVRSTNEEFLKMDKDYKLGFLKNPKRFNVAITRAKALLICIGNPYMLSKDEHWNQFLQYCRENGAYTGCPYSPEEEEQEIEALSSRMLGLNIVSELMSEEDVTAVSDPAWRGET